MYWVEVFFNCVVIVCITLAFLGFDIITGICGGIKEKAINSTALRDGAWHKAGFIGLIFLAYLLEVASLYVELGFEVPSVAAVCIYLIFTECVSIFENLCILNPEISNSPLGQLFKNTKRVKDAEKLEDDAS